MLRDIVILNILNGTNSKAKVYDEDGAKCIAEFLYTLAAIDVENFKIYKNERK